MLFCVCGIKAETRNVCTCFSASLNAIVTVRMDSDPRTFAVWLHATVRDSSRVEDVSLPGCANDEEGIVCDAMSGDDGRR